NERQKWVNPTTTGDLMSYCNPRWISQYQYQRALARFDPAAQPVTRAPAAPPVPDGEGNYLAVGGVVVDGALEQFDPGHRVTLPGGSSDHPGSGAFSLEVQSAGGTVLFTRHFELIYTGDGDDSDSGAFLEVVPYADTARRIVVKHNGAVIGTRAASANAPTV